VRALAGLVAALGITPHSVTHAQSLERRVASAPAGTVGFTFATRENVCGDGISISISDDRSPGWNTRRTRRGMHIGKSMSGYREPCEIGTARVVLDRDGGTVSSVRVTVGGRAPRPGTDLGDVSSSEAARYLLALAPRLSGRSGDEAIMGAAVADSVVIWQQLLKIARDDDATESARKAALFWVSHEASTAAIAGLDSLATDESEDTRLRADALFHLAQRPDGEGIPALIRVVKHSKNPKLRRDAIFFLSQSGDPRALDLFEQILAGK
jgi:hypothetical protein